MHTSRNNILKSANKHFARLIREYVSGDITIDELQGKYMKEAPKLAQQDHINLQIWHALYHFDQDTYTHADDDDFLVKLKAGILRIADALERQEKNLNKRIHDYFYIA